MYIEKGVASLESIGKEFLFNLNYYFNFYYGYYYGISILFTHQYNSSNFQIDLLLSNKE